MRISKLSFRTTRVCAVATLLALLAACKTSAPVSPHESRTVFRSVNVIPMDRPGTLTNQDVIISGDRIVAITPAGTLPLKSTDHIVESAGQFLMPGLWDMHVHASGHPDSDPARTNLPLFAAYGIVGVRDMGSTLPDLALMRAAQRGDPFLPDLVGAGPLLDGPKRSWQPAIARPLSGTDDVRKAVAELRAAQVDFLKVYDGLSPEQFRVLVEAAKDAGLPIAGHIPLRVTLSEVAAAGQRSVEHVSLRLIAGCTANGSGAIQDMLQAWIKEGAEGKYRKIDEWYGKRDPAACRTDYLRAGQQGVFFTPTLSFEFFGGEWTRPEDLEALSPQARKECEFNLSGVKKATAATRDAALEALMQLVRDLHQAGVPLLAGTDVPNSCLSPGRSLHKELQLLHRAGLTPQEVLQTATLNPARFLGRQDEGIVRPGAVANLLLLDGNPLDDVAHTQRISGVMRAGHWRDRAQLDAAKVTAIAAYAKIGGQTTTRAFHFEPSTTSRPESQ